MGKNIWNDGQIGKKNVFGKAEAKLSFGEQAKGSNR
jgi:hypothetical protein